MNAQSTKLIGISAALLASLAAGCGDVARNGRSPVLAFVSSLQASAGPEGEFDATLNSDVWYEDQEVPGTIYNDVGEATIRLQLRDLGIPGVPSTPTPMNDVTFTRYRVSYRRTDGRNTPGVDVPHAFDSAVTVTVQANGEATTDFVIVRHSAKAEAPLGALKSSSVIISMIADVTFYGRDQAGNDVTATGSIGIFFGNFGNE